MIEGLKFELFKMAVVFPFSLTFSSIGVFLFGGLSDLHIYLIYIVMIDFVLGVINYTFYQKNLNSTSMGKGIFKKISYFIAISVVYRLEQLELMELFGIQDIHILTTSIIVGFIITELLSVIEHLKSFGVKLPDVLTNALNNKKKEIYEEEKKENEKEKKEE